LPGTQDTVGQFQDCPGESWTVGNLVTTDLLLCLCARRITLQKLGTGLDQTCRVDRLGDYRTNRLSGATT